VGRERPGRADDARDPFQRRAVPAVGLGSSATFAQVARRRGRLRAKEVMAAMLEHGGTIFDTAPPSYGASEEVAGGIARELGATDEVFWATKVNVAGAGGGRADPAAAARSSSFVPDASARTPIDLIQVHNLGDVPTQLGLLKELKEAGRVRYIGVTTTFPPSTRS
jgi:aryl-alcohol dehydrogenase-like predicted oxidoreductase